MVSPFSLYLVPPHQYWSANIGLYILTYDAYSFFSPYQTLALPLLELNYAIGGGEESDSEESREDQRPIVANLLQYYIDITVGIGLQYMLGNRLTKMAFLCCKIIGNHDTPVWHNIRYLLY